MTKKKDPTLIDNGDQRKTILPKLNSMRSSLSNDRSPSALIKPNLSARVESPILEIKNNNDNTTFTITHPISTYDSNESNNGGTN